MRSAVKAMALMQKAKSDWGTRSRAIDDALTPNGSAPLRVDVPAPNFLQVPPFPGAQAAGFEHVGSDRPDIASLIQEIRRHRVGGKYWAGGPNIPCDQIVVRSQDVSSSALRELDASRIIRWSSLAAAPSGSGKLVIDDDCDPWSVLEGALGIVLDAGDDVLRLIAAIMGIRCYVYYSASDRLEACAGDAADLAEKLFPSAMVRNPFMGEAMSVCEAVELCGFWRRLIESNRSIVAGLGFAFWKQQHVAPLLWDGRSPFKFARTASDLDPNTDIAVWRAKVSQKTIEALQAKDARLVEVEDGFLRSRGLGADCVPPLSIAVDRTGAHFDASYPSELEELLEHGSFDARILSRARELRSVIVAQGLGKYEGGTVPVERPKTDRRLILVTGQVEDDRAVLSGGCGLTSNLALLRKVRERAPDAYIIYKPHPDVVAGHRRGAIADRSCLEFADQIMTRGSIAAIIAMVDEVHVNTSLTGFEAVLRGKPVTTYGVPFYAGWGLTTDLGPVPARRTARRTVDELVAAALILYPRYLDPATGLPCPAEVVVRRLTGNAPVSPAGIVVTARRLQGRLMRRLRSSNR